MNQLDTSIPQQDMPKPEVGRGGPVVAGFWRRLGAFLLDMVMLGLFGQLLGYFLFDQMAAMGQWGRLFGWSIAVVYFGCMNSRLPGGQTLGKRLLGIVVVDRQGKLISVEKSLLRSGILLAPLFLNGAAIPVDQMPIVLGYLLGLVVFGGNTVIIYLFLFNRRTRQNIHDLALGTLVVRKPVQETPIEKRTWPVHYAVSISLCLVILGLMFWLVDYSKSEPLKGIHETRGKIVQETGTENVGLFAGSTTWYMNGKSSVKTHVVCTVTLRHKEDDLDSYVNRVAAIILQSYPPALKKDRLRVTVTYGFDIGFARFHNSDSRVNSPEEWLKKLDIDNQQPDQLADQTGGQE